jgi:hypothetical protein
VRQLIRLKDASLFEKFMKLLAGRAGQIMNHRNCSGGLQGKLSSGDSGAQLRRG